MKVAFYTLGCKVNQYETQVIRESFVAAGHTAASCDAPFNAVVVNSCTVTAESDRKTRQALHRFRKEHPDAAIILTGCMAQTIDKHSGDGVEADVIVGNSDITKIVKYTEKFLSDGEKIIDITVHKKDERFSTPILSDFAERTRAYMKIEDGCERYCTYCIIPAARGNVRSKPLDLISEEAKKLSASGFSEIVLVGINLTSYGKDEGNNLCDAVDEVCAVDGIKRVRLGSLEPDHMSDEMLERLKKQSKFCPQFHLSLQSGCDDTLNRMNRHYDTAFYRDLVTRIRRLFPDSAITTDIMVGFAGESEREFKESLEFAKEIGFAKTHVFAYSRRPGTVAYGLPSQVTKSEKADRSRLMISAAKESEKAFLNSMTGKVYPVLFETACQGFAEGYTPNYSKIKVKTDLKLNGKILDVKIISAEQDFCIGELN